MEPDLKPLQPTQTGQRAHPHHWELPSQCSHALPGSGGWGTYRDLWGVCPTTTSMPKSELFHSACLIRYFPAGNGLRLEDGDKMDSWTPRTENRGEARPGRQI